MLPQAARRPRPESSEKLTADDLYRMPDHGGRHELVKGELTPISPASMQHGRITYRIGFLIGQYVYQEKVRDYLTASVQLVWIINPQTKMVTEYQRDGSVRLLMEDETLEGGAVLPGFSLAVSAIFAEN